MCAQCMVTAATVTGAATGLRAWLAARTFAWLTPTRLKRITLALMVSALLASATMSGTAGP